MEYVNAIENDHTTTDGYQGLSLMAANGEADTALIRLLLPKLCDVEWVENKRIDMIKGHLETLLSIDMTSIEENLEIAYLQHLGAAALVAYLPQK